MITEADKTFEYFAIVPPGLEQIAAKEFITKIELFAASTTPEIEVMKGGLNIKATEATIACLHYQLKIPTRILKRVASFRCRDLPRFYNKCKKLPWNENILSSTITIKVSTKKSRLIHTKKIEQSFRDAFADYRKGHPPKKKDQVAADIGLAQTIYINFNDDICTLSIDLTGERLNIRGERTKISKAPLRENLAAALCYELHLQCPELKTLIDPMAGSGVFILESFQFYQKNKRSFAFEYQLPYLYKDIPYSQQNYPPLFQQAIANEYNKDIYEALQFNIAEHGKNIFLIQQNYKDLSLEHYANEMALICNLPYGERIKVGNLKDFYSKFCQWCEHHSSIKAMGLLFPRKWTSFFNEQLKQFQQLKKLNFQNGGIPVSFVILKRRGLHQNKPSS